MRRTSILGLSVSERRRRWASEAQVLVPPPMKTLFYSLPALFLDERAPALMNKVRM